MYLLFSLVRLCRFGFRILIVIITQLGLGSNSNRSIILKILHSKKHRRRRRFVIILILLLLNKIYLLP